MSPLSGCCARLWWTVSSQLAEFPRGVEEKAAFAQRWVLISPRSSGRGSDWAATRALIGRRKVGYVDFLSTELQYTSTPKPWRILSAL